MLPFSTLILRDYYRAIGWNEDNSYSQLTRSSSALLDFQLPQSLVLQLANSPTPIFFTSYALDALPQLNGSVSYITTSEALDQVGPSRSLAFRHVVDRFRIYPLPHRPLPKDEVWLGGRRVEGRDYLLYSRLHFPSLHLSGLATTRLTPTLQFHLAFLSRPQPPSARPTSPSGPTHSRQLSESSSSSGPSSTQRAPPGNIMLSLQHDTGQYATEYTYSVQDGMFGLRGIWNFGWKGMTEKNRALVEALEAGSSSGGGGKVKGSGGDDEEGIDIGTRGRFSAGGEVYFSAQQRSFGISTGLRYTTLPTLQAVPSGASALSPPTALTLLYNPLMGFLSTAYSAQVSPSIALSTRFGVNVYSYESDLAVGGEWWIGRRRGKRAPRGSSTGVEQPSAAELVSGLPPATASERDIGRAAMLDEGDRSPRSRDGAAEMPGPFASERVYPGFSRPTPSVQYPSNSTSDPQERDGILKARISGNWSVSLLYEARIRNCLVSMGVVSDLLSRQKPIRSIGVEVQYFS